MKYLDEYRNGDAARALADAIGRAATRDWALMEVCGGQTHSIVKYGIDQGIVKNDGAVLNRAVVGYVLVAP